MSFNAGKFRVLQYGAPKEGPCQCRSLSQERSITDSVSEIKDLGIILSADGKFLQHVERAVSKGRQMMGWVLRTFARQTEPMLMFYKTIIIPHLEYYCQVWSPVSLGSIRRVESVQRIFTVRLEGVKGLNYWQRLQRLSIYSL